MIVLKNKGKRKELMSNDKNEGNKNGLKDCSTHFIPLVLFDTPCKHNKTKGFLMFSGVVVRGQWRKTG